MARDIKKMFENYRPEPSEIPSGHEVRFEAKLSKAFSETISEEKNTSFPWLKIAAIAIVFFAVSFFGYQQLSNSVPKIDENANNVVVEKNAEKLEKSDSPKLTLASLSPDLKKVEEYYITSINVQLASLKIDAENKELVDGYMQRLAALDKEYTSLNVEMNKVGPTEATVTALIDNLKMRLDLLFKLKTKLKELKNQNNEEFKAIQT